MITTIKTKDVGAVQDKIRPECEHVRTFEDSCEDYIKLNLGLVRNDGYE